MKNLACLAALAMSVSNVFAWPQYRLERVYATDQHLNSDFASSINNHGDVVVSSGENWDSADAYIAHSDGIRTLIPRAPGFWYMSNGSISDSGHVTGFAIGTNFSIHNTAQLYTPGLGTEALNRFTYWNNVNSYYSTGVNNSGTVIGYTYFYDGGGIGGACAWNYSGRVDGYLPGVSDTGDSEALDINDAGTIVGGSPYATPCRWLPGGNIEYLAMGDGCTHGWVTSVNEAGWMVGMAAKRINSNTNQSYLQVWNPSGALVSSIRTGTSALDGRGSSNSFVRAYVNDSNNVAVADVLATGVAKMWLWNSFTGLQPLEPLIASGFSSSDRLDSLRGYNNRGQIVCSAVVNGVYSHNYVLTPVPEPGTLAVLALGAVGLLKRRKISSSD